MLKEFIPGKQIRFSNHDTTTDQALELKLACVRGVIHYWRDQARGIIKTTIEQTKPIVPYDVLIDGARVVNQEGEPAEGKIILSKGAEIGQSLGLAAISNQSDHVVVKIRNERKQIGKDRLIGLGKKGLATSTEEMKQELVNKGFSAMDKRIEFLEDPRVQGYYLLYAFTDADKWGFTIRVMNYDQEGWKYYDCYEPFEGLDAYENFFDGLH